MEEQRKAQVVIVWRPKPGSPERRVLLLRLLPDRGGFWQPVTGSIEDGETYAQGALREAEEETGLRFDRAPQYLGLEHGYSTRWGKQARERAFLLPLHGGSAPPTPTLDGKEHDAFEWVSPEEAAGRMKFAANRKAIERAAAGIPPLLLSARGSFQQEGEEITHARTAELLHRSLVRKEQGGYTVKLGDEELDVIVEDNPRFVLSFDRDRGALRLSDGTEEPLRAETLRVRADHSCVCELANGWPATFTSPAYYELTREAREGSVPGEYVLHFGGREHRLRVPGEGEGVDR